MRRALLLALLACCAVPGTAGAATVVTAPDGTKLSATLRDRELCLRISPTRGEDDGECSRAPASVQRSFGVYSYVRGHTAWHGGVTTAEVARVELHINADGRDEVVTTETVAGPHGLRYWLVRARALGPWLTKYLRADGTTAHAENEFGEEPLLSAPRVLARGPARTRLLLARRPRLAATPLDRGRIVEESCLQLDSPGSTTVVGCSTVDSGVPDDLETTLEGSCGRTRVAVTTGERVRRVVLVLGDGRRASISLFDLPEELAGVGARAGALNLRGAIAVRRAEGFDADGRRVAVEQLGRPPAQPCDEEDGGTFGSVSIGSFAPDQTGPLRAAARDERALLCFSFGDFDRLNRDCALPPLDAASGFVWSRRVGDRALYGGVLPPEVATVELVVDGVRRRFPTTGDLPGYGGQYRDVVRFAAIELPASARVTDGRLLAANGRILNHHAYFDPRAFRPRTRALRTLRIDGVRLRVVRVSVAGRSAACILLAGEAFFSCRDATGESASIDALCSPRRMVVVGGVPTGGRGVVIGTSRGRVRPRIVRLGADRAFVAVLPPGVALRSIAIRGGPAGRQDERLPPAREQCGYDDEVFFPGVIS